jgi:hypothetical protein
MGKLSRDVYHAPVIPQFRNYVSVPFELRGVNSA